jgi:hypothetical protein
LNHATIVETSGGLREDLRDDLFDWRVFDGQIGYGQFGQQAAGDARRLRLALQPTCPRWY